jgi:hypothetical protein
MAGRRFFMALAFAGGHELILSLAARRNGH